MPNIAKVLREEIQRLAKRQARAALRPVRRDHVRLKKIVLQSNRWEVHATNVRNAAAKR